MPPPGQQMEFGSVGRAVSRQVNQQVTVTNHVSFGNSPDVIVGIAAPQSPTSVFMNNVGYHDMMPPSSGSSNTMNQFARSMPGLGSGGLATCTSAGAESGAHQDDPVSANNVTHDTGRLSYSQSHNTLIPLRGLPRAEASPRVLHDDVASSLNVNVSSKHVSTHRRQKRNPIISKRLARKIPTNGVIPRLAVWDSIGLTNPNVLKDDAAQYGWTDTETMYVVQYFEQVAMIEGQDRILTILQRRQTANNLGYLDPLDPFRMFPARNLVTEIGVRYKTKAGVPYLGYVLPSLRGVPQQALPTTDALFRRQHEWNNQINSFPSSWEPLPIGTTVMDIIKMYPNHIYDAFLDALLQHRVAPSKIWQALEAVPVHFDRPLNMLDMKPHARNMIFPIKTMANLLRAVGIVSPSQSENFITKRLTSRMDVLLAKYPADVLKFYLAGDNHCVVRELGEGLAKGGCNHGDVEFAQARRDRALQKIQENNAGQSTAQGRVQTDTPARPTTPQAAPMQEDLVEDSEEVEVAERRKTPGPRGQLPKIPVSETQMSKTRTPTMQVPAQSSDSEDISTTNMKLPVDWSDDELLPVVDRAMKIVGFQVDDIILLLARHPEYKTKSSDEIKGLASEVLRKIISRQYVERPERSADLRIELGPRDALKRTMLAQLRVEAYQVSKSGNWTSADSLKKMAVGRIGQLYLTISFFICSGVIRMLRGRQSAAAILQGLVTDYPRAEHISYALETTKGIEACHKGSVDPRDHTYLGANVATMLAREADGVVFRKVGCSDWDDESKEWRIKDKEWVKQMLIVLNEQKENLGELLKGDAELRQLSNASHNAIIRVLNMQFSSFLSNGKTGTKRSASDGGDVTSAAEVGSSEAVESPRKKAKTA